MNTSLSLSFVSRTIVVIVLVTDRSLISQKFVVSRIFPESPSLPSSQIVDRVVSSQKWCLFDIKVGVEGSFLGLSVGSRTPVLSSVSPQSLPPVVVVVSLSFVSRKSLTPKLGWGCQRRSLWS